MQYIHGEQDEKLYRLRQLPDPSSAVVDLGFHPQSTKRSKY